MKTVLITGGTSGIGLAFVKLFVKDGWRVVAVASSSSMPDDSPEVIYIQQDLSKDGAAAIISEKIRKMDISIEALINNAGFGQYGRFDKIPIARQSDMLHVNTIALTELTHTFLPSIIKSKGMILNVASSAAFFPGPYMNVYFASKHYVLAFSEALHEELKPEGVSVTTLCPGPTQTHFEEDSGAGKTTLFRGTLPTADEVALFGYKALQKNQSVAIHKFQNRLLIWAARFAPKNTIRKLATRSLKK